jgi:hypothetical protein
MAMGNQEAPTPQDYHNQNCFAYLKAIKITPETLLDALFKEYELLIDLFNENEILSGLFDKQQFVELRSILTNPDYKYNPDISYANLYSRFLTILEEKLSTQDPNLVSHFRHESDYKTWFDQIYANKNDVLSQTFELFKDKLSERSLVDPRPEQVVATALNAFVATDSAHLFTPQEMGSALGRFSALISANFKPMLTTSIPSVRNYNYTQQDQQNPQELRFGTQAQRHDDQVRVSPLFKEWLRIHQTNDEDKIDHVYFNLLGADRTDYEGKKEKEMTEALAHLEKDHPNLAMITLPADKGLMQSNAFEESTKAIRAQEAFQQMKAIVMGTSDLAIKDFYVSDRIKGKLYANGTEEDKVTQLLQDSFKKMGINPQQGENISKAQQQAVWFHFCKYQFPDFVLNTLKPNTWNASCKDAIDRGGVASSYLNLMRSFTSENPMSREEFEQSLHAAAAVVKGRGLNHHYEIIWNAINQYVDANFEQLGNTPAQRWLIHWRNDNTPYAVAQSHEYLKKVIEQNQQLIEQIEAPQKPQLSLKQKSLEVINTVKSELFEDEGKGSAKPTSGKRLLLEVVSKTTQLALEPDVKNTREQLNHALETLNKQSIFKPICRLLTTFIDFLAKHFTSVREMRGNFYSTLVRHGDDRSAVKKLKEDTQQLIPSSAVNFQIKKI